MSSLDPIRERGASDLDQVDHHWVLGVSAGQAGPVERLRISRVLEDERPVPGTVLLTTCHRVELYGFGDPPALDEGLRLARGEAAVVHLMRVAAGLESAVVGEDEVLHQVRTALGGAIANHPVDPQVRRMFELAVSAGRRARAGRTASSAGLATRAVGWLQALAVLRDRPVLVGGAGRMGSALAHAARRAGASVTIASRDASRARRLAEVYGGVGVDLAEGAELARHSAGVAIALSGPWADLGSLAVPLPAIADISAPSAVPALLRQRLNGGFLGIDDLFAAGGSPPSGYVEDAERVVAGKTREYLAWLEARR